MKSIHKTSWTNRDLEQLTNPRNHKITFDGNDYWWYHRINGNKWELHCIKPFKDYSKPYSWLKEWLYKWKRELEARKSKEIARGLYEMEQELLHSNQVKDIIADLSMKTKLKIKLLLDLLPNESASEIAKLLDITEDAFNKQVRRNIP